MAGWGVLVLVRKLYFLIKLKTEPRMHHQSDAFRNKQTSGCEEGTDTAASMGHKRWGASLVPGGSSIQQIPCVPGDRFSISRVPVWVFDGLVGPLPASRAAATPRPARKPTPLIEMPQFFGRRLIV